MIVPRAVTNTLRISRYLFRFLWAVWPGIAYRLYARDDDRREDFLAVFAPFALVSLLLVWVAVLLFGYALVFYGLRGGLRPAGATFADAVYYAGSSLFTLGYGDITAHSMPARALSLAAGASGLGVVALVVTFLFSVFGEFQQRERFVVSLGARSGMPPSGTGLLAVHCSNGITGDLAGVFASGQTWAAGVMESHLAYPALVYFRSSHDYESWIGALGTLLDAAVLVLTTLDGVPRGQARIMYDIGVHLTHDFTRYFNLPAQADVGIVRSEFEDACARLAAAGFTIEDRQSAWERFCELRSVYAGSLNALARWLEIPPIEWVGDRSMLSHH